MEWLKVFPTAEKFAKASNERLYQFLRTHSIGISPQWRARVEDHAIFDSLPGAGKKLAPRLFAIFGTERSRYATPDPLRLLSGVAPVMKQSCKKRHVTIRRACKKPWRNTMHQFAWCSKKYRPWAKAFYDHRRAQGDGNAQALRKLADKWLKIIHRMWRERVPYNEAKYVESIHKRKKPSAGLSAGG